MNFLNKIKSKFLKKSKTETSDTKYAFEGINVKFSAETEKIRLRNEEELYSIIKSNINMPDKLINSVLMKGIKVYRIKNCEKILKKINKEEGFIFPQKGIKALKLNMLICKEKKEAFKFSFSTPPMFIFEQDTAEIYTIAYALHQYYAFKSKLPGCDSKSQQLFEKTRNGKNQRFISKMKIKEVAMCKEAIARDLEAINFALRISKEFGGAKNALNKLKSDNSAII